MAITIQVDSHQGPSLVVHLTLPGATEVTEDTLEPWLDGIAAELQAIPGLGAHIASLKGPYVPPTDTSAIWVRIPVPRVALDDEPVITDALVDYAVDAARSVLRNHLARRRADATA